ncbi:MAG TPA: hypothetical protein VGL38_07520 [bacterium]|jgi:hypothetical protein
MSPTATRNSRAVKRTAKTAESKSSAKKVVPPSKKATKAVAPAAGRAKPAAKAVRTVPMPAPKPAVRKPDVSVKSKLVKSAPPLKKKLVVDVEKPKKKIEDVAPEEKLDHTPKTKAAKAEAEPSPKKTIKPALKAPADEPMSGDDEDTPKSLRGRKPKAESGDKPGREKGGRASKMKPLDPIDEFLADDVPVADDIDEEDAVIPEDLSELDPLDLPLALLDPELVEVPRPAGPVRPKPKPRVERNPKQCAGCGNMFTWLSVDQLCFNCLKKKLAAKKREDEAYGGFTPEAEEDDGGD